MSLLEMCRRFCSEQYVAAVLARVINEIIPGKLRHIMLQSDFIESLFSAPDWGRDFVYDAFCAMVHYGKLRMLCPDFTDQRQMSCETVYCLLVSSHVV